MLPGERSVALNPGAFPVLRIALVFAIGVLAGRHIPPDIPFTILFFIVSGMFLLYAFCRQFASPAGRIYLLPLIYLFCIAGFGLLHSFKNHQTVPAGEKVLQVFEPGDLIYYGGIISDRKTRTGNLLLTVRIDSVEIHGLPTWYLPFKTEALLRTSSGGFSASKKNIPGKLPETGSYIHFNGDLRIPEPPRNPNQFDYASFLARQGIHTQLFISEIIHTDRDGDHPFWIRHQVRIRSNISNLFSDSNSALARAIILGDRSRLDHTLRTDFSRAGLAHLMAVSGMHVGFILLPVWFLLPWFRKSHAWRMTALIAGGSILLGYAGITGFSVSVSRASLMALFLMIARLFHRPGTSMNILGAAACILLFLDPLMLFDVGFQLSFLAVIIILATLPATRYLLPPQHRYRKTGALFQFVMVSVLVQGGLYPLLIHYFNEFSIAGPLSNTLAVPFVQFMFLWSFLCLGVSLFHTDAAVLLNIPGDFILTILTEYVTWTGSQPAAWLEGTLPGYTIFGVWFFGFSMLASIRLPALRWKMVCGFLICCTLFQAGKIYDRVRPPELKITFYDVGQGDAVLMQTPGGYHYLYDTGVWTPNFDSGERTILPELKAKGITRLDGVILSHPHADHIGGIISLMKHIPIDTIYQSPIPYDSRIYQRYMELASAKNIPIRKLSSGDMIFTDTATPKFVLAPSDRIQATDPNNRSIVLLVQYGNTRVLLTGDAEKEAESYLVETYGGFLESDIMKVGHHGSRTSSTIPFLEHVNATKGIASQSLNNRFGHPHREAALRLQKMELNVHYTSLEGAVLFKSDGRQFRHVTWRDHPPPPHLPEKR